MLGDFEGERVKQVLIVASSAIARAGLTALIMEQTDQWQAFSIAALSDWPQQNIPSPDTVLLDLSHQGNNLSVEILKVIENFPAPVVVLLEESSEPNLPELLHAGVQGILVNNAAPAEMVAALEAVTAGLVALPADLMADLIEGVLGISSNRNSPTVPSQALTQREIEVLTLLAEGLGNKEVARRLTISEHTVKFHISTLFAKLNASSRTEAVMIGARLGLILL
ncbi:MAG TPA: response regulator transcription factor [Leptolyngbyaceae cyanobacterium]